MPPQPTAASTAPHYTWGDPGVPLSHAWRLVETPALSVIEERMPPGTAERRHLHRLSRQFFYVLAGTLTLALDDAHHTLTPHTGLEIPPNTPHQAFNHSPAETRFLVISQPHAHGDRHDA